MKDLFDVIDCMRSPPEKKFKLGLLQKWDPRLEPDLVIYNAVSSLHHLFFVFELWFNNYIYFTLFVF